MVWAILIAIGIPLWICAVGISVLVWRDRTIRHRPGNIPVRLRREGARRWTRGYGVWVDDVFAFRGSPAAWSEDLEWVAKVEPRELTDAERKKHHRLDNPVLATFTSHDSGARFEVVAAGESLTALLGPVGAAAGGS